MKFIKIFILQCIPFVSGLLTVSAQPNDLMITYDANQGVSGLAGAAKVYMYSGAVTSGPSGQWEWITGSVNLDDGVGEMTPLGNNVWTICIDPNAYYGTALPILAIDIIFRNENGSAFGYDFNGTYTIIDMTTPSPTSSFSGVTTGNCGVGVTETENNIYQLRSFPNPLITGTVFQCQVPPGTGSAHLNVYETTGKMVRSFNLGTSTTGFYHLEWAGDSEKGALLKNGVYFYALEADGVTLKTSRLAIIR